MSTILLHLILFDILYFILEPVKKPWRAWTWKGGMKSQQNTSLVSMVTLQTMMTLSIGNIFRVTGHLCGEFTGNPVNSPHKGQWRGALMLSTSWAWISGWVNTRKTGDLKRHRAHYDVTFLFKWGYFVYWHPLFKPVGVFSDVWKGTSMIFLTRSLGAQHKCTNMV